MCSRDNNQTTAQSARRFGRLIVSCSASGGVGPSVNRVVACCLTGNEANKKGGRTHNGDKRVFSRGNGQESEASLDELMLE